MPSAAIGPSMQFETVWCIAVLEMTMVSGVRARSNPRDPNYLPPFSCRKPQAHRTANTFL
jgi:hypothetical protein